MSSVQKGCYDRTIHANLISLTARWFSLILHCILLLSPLLPKVTTIWAVAHPDRLVRLLLLNHSCVTLLAQNDLASVI